jgi:hypothetical protein
MRFLAIGIFALLFFLLHRAASRSLSKVHRSTLQAAAVDFGCL